MRINQGFERMVLLMEQLIKEINSLGIKNLTVSEMYKQIQISKREKANG